MDELARGVVAGAVAERVVAAVATVLEELALHPGHPLGVEVTLELVGKTELAEHVAPRRPIEAGPGHVRDQERHLESFELMAQVEHQPDVAGQAG